MCCDWLADLSITASSVLI